ncbi:MAG: S16 family serine protease [Thermodesulfobacteriota bacterium]|nr:S16 family serine protease [Thermodesulfobacteriota bacterium]
MKTDYTKADYAGIKNDVMGYPDRVGGYLNFLEDTARVVVPADPVDRVILQSKAKAAIRNVARSRGHVLMVGKPGVGKSMLAEMFEQVIGRSMGDYLRPENTILAYPGKDKHHIRVAYENPDTADALLDDIYQRIETVRQHTEPFSLDEQIRSVKKVKRLLLGAATISAIAGFFFPPAFIATGMAGIGAIFMYIQENNHKAQEKIQQETHAGRVNPVKHMADQVPEVLFDPRKETRLMKRVASPAARNMKGGFRHDPYQSGNLHTPAHKRAFLGAHATAPILYVDELKTMIKAGYMPDMLETMQSRRFILEGTQNSGSGAADRSENPLRADNIIIACCNHDTLDYLRNEGEGAFLSRIEDRGEIIHMESAVPETARTVNDIAQYIKQELMNLEEEFQQTWGDIRAKEGHEGVRKRNEHILGRALPDDYRLEAREFDRSGILEIIKALRCRSQDGKLSCILRPVNGIIRAAEHNAIIENADAVSADHVAAALADHVSIEGAMSREITDHKKRLKTYLDTMTDAVGYVVGLAVIQSSSGSGLFGQPLPIHCQINAGANDAVLASGKTGDIAKGAAQNVRASIKRILTKTGAPHINYEMHVEYIQSHGGVEGDSASVAIDTGLISDYINMPVNQAYAVTGSLTGDVVLSVGGVSEKLKAAMDTDLNMKGACIPWQNRTDAEPLLLNNDSEYIEKKGIPGIRIHRMPGRRMPFDIYFIKTKYHAYEILMGIDEKAVKDRMAQRVQSDLALGTTASKP